MDEEDDDEGVDCKEDDEPTTHVGGWLATKPVRAGVVEAPLLRS